jgi:hypothetical protein
MMQGRIGRHHAEVRLPGAISYAKLLPSFLDNRTMGRAGLNNNSFSASFNGSDVPPSAVSRHDRKGLFLSAFAQAQGCTAALLCASAQR